MTSLFLSSLLMAQGTAAQAPKAPGFMDMIPMLAVMFLIMYFLIIRPQQKRQKELQNLMDTLKPGLEVVTSGGIIGKIKAVSEGFVTLDVGQGSTLKVIKANIASTTEALRPAPAKKEEKK